MQRGVQNIANKGIIADSSESFLIKWIANSFIEALPYGISLQNMKSAGHELEYIFWKLSTVNYTF